MHRKLTLLLAVFITLSCTVLAPQATLPTPTLQAITPASSATVPATPTPTPTLEPTVTLTPTATPFTPFNATAWADHTNVRANPGYLFDVVVNVDEETSYLVLGKSPGGEWIYGETPGKERGWIFTQLLEANQDLQAVPVIQPENVQVLKGRLANEQDIPISGIQFSIVKGQGQNVPRNDATTDPNGEFIAFMPPDASGVWTVSYTAIACTSNTMDANCTCIAGLCGVPVPEYNNITLPYSETLVFTWK